MAEKKFESAYKALERVVVKLGSDELELEQALKLYEEGIRHSRFCSRKLEEAEKKIKKLSKTSNGKLDTENLDLFDRDTIKKDTQE